jgi:hypothetical protein
MRSRGRYPWPFMVTQRMESRDAKIPQTMGVVHQKSVGPEQTFSGRWSESLTRTISVGSTIGTAN